MGRGSGRRGWWPGSPRGGLMPNAELRAFLSALGHIEAGGITEVCIFQGGKKPTHVGYFDNVEAAAKAIETHDGRGNIFVTLNPAKRSLLARCNNRLVEGTYKNPAERTKDTEIHRDLWFLFDVDPERPSGISSTDEEKREALEVAKAIRDWLMTIGVPVLAMITADSGNGAYVLVRTPDCEVTDEHTERKKAFLNFVADKFDTQRVKIDRTVYNPARLIGALGSLKVKGENTDERPHRRSSVRTIAGELFDASKEQYRGTFDLYDLAKKILPPAEAKKTKPGATNKTANGAYNGLDARKIAHMLENHKPTGNGFDRYDCPNCGNTQKLWVRADDGKFGCYEPISVCDWRKLRDRIHEIAAANRIPVAAAKTKQDAKPIQEVCLNDVEEEPIDWLWKPRIARGTLTFVEGIEGEGKSTVLCGIAAAVTGGQKLGDMLLDSPGNVLWLSAEDSLSHILKPRLVAAGAIQSRVFVVGETFTFDEDGVELVRKMVERRRPALVVIDPIFAYATGDASKGAYARDVTNQLKQIAEEFNCAIVLVRHVGKSKGFGDPRVAGLYSIEWRAAARSVLLCGSDPDNPDVKALTQSKNNMSRFAESIGYQLLPSSHNPEVAYAKWTGESYLTAKQILAQAVDEDEKAERVSPQDFLKEILKPGEQKTAEVQTAARKNGFSDRTLNRVKARLGVKCRNEGFGKEKIWYWSLPDKGEKEDAGEGKIPAEESVDEPQNDPGLDCQTEKSGNLRVDDSSKRTYSEKNPLDCHSEEYGNLIGCHTKKNGNLSENFPDNLNSGNGLPLDCHVEQNGNLSSGLFTGKPGKSNGNGNGASVPLMITSEMRRQLYELGYQGTEINKLTPDQAHHILATNAPPF